MFSHPKYLVIALAAFAAACDSGPPAQDASSAPPAEQEAPAQEAAPAAAPAEEPAPAATAADTETVTNKACVDALSKETEGGVTVLSNEFSEANTIVMLGVGANNAPWKCLVANDGTVQDLQFTGNDGDGVPPEEDAEAPPASLSEVSQAAIDSCLAAVQGQTNEPDQVVVSSEFSEANSLVMIGVGADRAPWKCLVSNDGQVQEAYFDGDEGAL